MQIKFFASSSAGNCGYISDGKTKILLDAGIRFKDLQMYLDYSLPDIAGCLVSHEHADHSKAVKELTKHAVDCYMAAETANTINVTSHRIRIVEPLKQFKIGTFTILPFELQHDVTNLGYLMASGKEKAVYIIDSFFCRYKFPGLTHVLMEVNWNMEKLNENVKNGVLPVDLKNRVIQSHMGLETAVEFLAANDLSNVKQIYILHMSNGNSDEKLIRETLQKKTGKEIIIVAEGAY